MRSLLPESLMGHHLCERVPMWDCTFPPGPCSMPTEKLHAKGSTDAMCIPIINWSALLYQLSAWPAHTPTNAYLVQSYILLHGDSLMLLWSKGYCGKQTIKHVHLSKHSTCFRLFFAWQKNPPSGMPEQRHFFIQNFHVGRDRVCALRQAELVKRVAVIIAGQAPHY